MPHQIGYVDNSSGLAHYAMLAAIKAFAESNGWTVLRYDTVPANRELILLAPGLSGTEEIYCGIRTYHSASADYYNLVAMAATGYVAGNTFDTQPGCVLSGVPAHDQRIDYWMTINGQRLLVVMKVGTPVYEAFYVGKMLPYGRPSQYPYPVICAGMLSGFPATRFSDLSHSIPFKGNRANLKLRFNSGAWLQPKAYPWANTIINGSTPVRDTEAEYPLIPVELSDTLGIYGVLDGVFHVSGFGMTVETVISISGINYVVFQDVYRTGFNDYYAVRMDT